jgi:hypothetical protein
MEGDIFDETYMDTLTRGLHWFATHGDLDNHKVMKIKIDIKGKLKEYEIKEISK